MGGARSDSIDTQDPVGIHARMHQDQSRTDAHA